MCGPQEGHCEKRCEWRPRNGCDGRIIVKILITTIQANLCCLLHVSLPNSPELLLLKFLLLTYHHIFFHNGHTLFFSLAVFGLNLTSFFACCKAGILPLMVAVTCLLFFLYVSRYLQCSTCVSCILLFEIEIFQWLQVN